MSFRSLISTVKYRLLFLLRCGTLKKVKVIDENSMCVSTSRGNFRMNRRCPHQGAFMEKGYFKDTIVTCHWHGCKVAVDKQGEKL